MYVAVPNTISYYYKTRWHWTFYEIFCPSFYFDEIYIVIDCISGTSPPPPPPKKKKEQKQKKTKTKKKNKQTKKTWNLIIVVCFGVDASDPVPV